jgi:cytidylate kinase
VRVITISGEVAVGTTSIAEALRDLLEWDLIIVGDWFRDYMLISGSDISQSALLPDDLHRKFDADQMRKINKSANLIVEGRLSGWLSRDFPEVFSVLCVTSPTIRVGRYIKRENVSQRNAEAIIRNRDGADLQKYYQLYGIDDYRLPEYYNLVLDTSTMSPRELAIEVCQHANLTNKMKRTN